MLYQKGLTLTELMIAVAIGLIVSAAVAGIFLQTSSSNTQNTQIGYIQDNGRYALKILSDELEMSNFWAGMSASDRSSIGFDDQNIARDGATATITPSIDATVNNCNSAAGWNYDFDFPLSYMNSTTATAANAAFPCVPTSPGVISGTDVMLIKRTKGFEVESDQVNGRPYIRGNRNEAVLHKFIAPGGTCAPGTDTCPPPTGYFDWQYLVNIYYVVKPCDSCAPQLRRQALKEAADPAKDPAFSVEELADGIERFHIEFGIDSSSDGVADFFTSSPTDTELTEAVMARIYVLARSATEVVGYTNKKTYQLGDLNVAAANDGYYRRVFSTAVMMKNTQAVLEM